MRKKHKPPPVWGCESELGAAKLKSKLGSLEAPGVPANVPSPSNAPKLRTARCSQLDFRTLNLIL
ncbi:hypothetical protein CFAM422_000729 [Trichoderma lentiforme]|uniref:Uncharacterized protein n=1 Tax=Trichoderma lentiforme TaxID=1567552 RepID=A0A9P5CIP8_9HYPO|nr:hypothetical protein CFAM422_000729 [Trichoderma lentiforme]